MIDLPPDDLPWLAVHPTAEGSASSSDSASGRSRGSNARRRGQLGLTETGWSPHFWSAVSGLDRAAIGVLRSGGAAEVVEPD